MTHRWQKSRGNKKGGKTETGCKARKHTRRRDYQNKSGNTKPTDRNTVTVVISNGTGLWQAIRFSSVSFQFSTSVPLAGWKCFRSRCRGELEPCGELINWQPGWLSLAVPPASSAAGQPEVWRRTRGNLAAEEAACRPAESRQSARETAPGGSEGRSRPRHAVKSHSQWARHVWLSHTPRSTPTGLTEAAAGTKWSVLISYLCVFFLALHPKYLPVSSHSSTAGGTALGRRSCLTERFLR